MNSKAIIQAGIKKVVYLERKNRSDDTYKISAMLLEKAKVKRRKYSGRDIKISYD
jgi:deoxycytidylate deaminase